MTDTAPKPQSSLALSALFNFYQKSKVPISELEKFENDFEETGRYGGGVLWSPKIGRTEDEIVELNRWVLCWVWNFRDFLAKNPAIIGKSKAEAIALCKEVVTGSQALRICGYFRNDKEHFGVDRFVEYREFEQNPPRLGEVSIQHLSPDGSAAISGNIAGVMSTKASEAVPFVQTVLIEGLSAPTDTRRIAEEAAWDWVDFLKANGRDLGVTKPQPSGKTIQIDRIEIGEPDYFMPPEGWCGVRLTVLDLFIGRTLTSPGIGINVNLFAQPVDWGYD